MTLTWSDNGRRLIVPRGLVLHVRPGPRVLPTGSTPSGTVLRRTSSSPSEQDYLARLPGVALVSANSTLHDRGSGYLVAVQVEGIDLVSARFTSAEVGWGATGLRFEKNGSTVAGVARTTDGGRVWREVAPPLPPKPVSSRSEDLLPVFPSVVVVPLSDQAAWAFATTYPGSAQAYLTTDGGRTWRTRPIKVPVQSAAAGDTTHAIVFFDSNGPPGPSGAMTSDGGAQWTPVSLMPLSGTPRGDPADNAPIGVVAVSSTRIIASMDPEGPTGERPFVEESVDGGAHWRATELDVTPGSSPFPLPCSMSAPSFVSAEVGFVLAECGREQVFRTTDGGTTWAPAGLLSPPPPDGEFPLAPHQVSFVNATDGWAFEPSADGVRLAQTHDGGATWASGTLDLPGRPPNPSVQFVSTRIGYAWASSPNAMYRTTDGGSTWQKLPVPG